MTREELESIPCLKNKKYIYINKTYLDDFSILMDGYKCVLKSRFKKFESIKKFLKNNDITHTLIKEDSCFYYFNYFNNDWEETTKEIDLFKIKLKLKNYNKDNNENIEIIDITLDNVMKNKYTNEIKYIDLKGID